MTEPTIREATLADAADIARVHVEGWRWGYRDQLPSGLLDGLSVERREAGRREALEHAAVGDRTFVAEVTGRIVGFADCGPTHDADAASGTGELYSIYVEEDVAGHGVGRALMRTVVEFMAAHGFRRATLWVLVTNDRARRFYEAAGWRPDGAEKTESHPREGTPLHEIRYALELDASGAHR